MNGLSLERCTSNLKSLAIALTVLELLAFNARKFRVSRDPGPFGEILRAHVRSIPGNMPVKFEVRSFNRFGLISI